MLETATLYCFSPTGGTRKAAEIFCAEIARDVAAVDLGTRTEFPETPAGDLTVLAAPVFGGRIPALTAGQIQKLNGTGKKAVTLAVYGNRAFEDALLELNETAAGAGFEIVASGALIAQHSIVPEVGKGRPDSQDAAGIRAFAQNVLAKLESGSRRPVTVPGNHPYKTGAPSSATPVSLPSCKLCGRCAAVCPVEAISLTKESVTTSAACMMCMACAAACPEKARILPPPLQGKLEQMLGAFQSVRRENTYFL